jgi:monoamine oxidase
VRSRCGGARFAQPWHTRARAAILTAPLGLLTAATESPGAIRFTPPLAAKQVALAGLLCGPALKVALRFREPFWERPDGGRYADTSFFHAPDSVFPTFWTTHPIRSPLLTAWVGGPSAARLCALEDEAVIRQALACVRALFGRRRAGGAQLQAAYVHNWERDSFARGAYSYVAVGGGQARKLLATPLEGTLFFAGEATDTTGEPATVTGALRSGARAAREARRHLEAG